MVTNDDLLRQIDALKAEIHRLTYGTSPTFGCHADLDEGQEPDGCVIDEGKPQNCTYAHRYKDKTECAYWRPIKVVR